MTARDVILNVLLNAEGPLPAQVVAERAGTQTDHTRHVLRDLYKEELIRRKSAAWKGSWAYYYFVGEEEKEVAEVSRKSRGRQSGVDVAIERTRAKWRKGELFTREQVREYREKYGRLKSHGVIRT